MFKKGKLYINNRSTIIVLCTNTSKRIDKFTGTVVWSETAICEQGYHSTTWIKNRFKEHTSSIDLKGK